MTSKDLKRIEKIEARTKAGFVITSTDIQWLIAIIRKLDKAQQPNLVLNPEIRKQQLAPVIPAEIIKTVEDWIRVAPNVYYTDPKFFWDNIIVRHYLYE